MFTQSAQEGTELLEAIETLPTNEILPMIKDNTVNAKNVRGTTPLHLACTLGKKELIDPLIHGN